MPRRKNKHPNSFAGRGMKPRGNAEELKVESAQTENAVSTDQVQEQGSGEVVDAEFVETETPPSQEAKTVQLLENQPEVPKAASELAELLRKSAEAACGASPDVANVKPKEEISPYISDHELRARYYPLLSLDPETGAVTVVPEGVGPKPNGDLALVITIPESYVTSVKDFAEADGNKSVEQWSSEFFVMNLEAYCTPLKGR